MNKLIQEFKQRQVKRQKKCSECKRETDNTYQNASGDIICPRCYIEIMSNVTEQK